jgi:hypothetical protein
MSREPIFAREIEAAIKQCESNKALGENRITADVQIQVATPKLSLRC